MRLLALGSAPEADDPIWGFRQRGARPRGRVPQPPAQEREWSSRGAGSDGNLTGPGVQLRRRGQDPGSAPAGGRGGRTCRARSGERGAGKARFRAAGALDPERPRAPGAGVPQPRERRAGKRRPPRRAVPYLAPPGARSLGFGARGSLRSWRPGRGKGGRPLQLGTPRKGVRELGRGVQTLVSRALGSRNAVRPLPGYHFTHFCQDWHTECACTVY